MESFVNKSTLNNFAPFAGLDTVIKSLSLVNVSGGTVLKVKDLSGRTRYVTENGLVKDIEDATIITGGNVEVETYADLLGIVTTSPSLYIVKTDENSGGTNVMYYWNGVVAKEVGGDLTEAIEEYLPETDKNLIYQSTSNTAFESENGMYYPVLRAEGLESSTGLTNHASGGIVASVAGTTGSGNLYLPRAIDPTKPWRCAVLIEINDAQPITNLHFSNANGDWFTGARINNADTGSVSSDLAGTSLAVQYGFTGGIPSGTKLWFGLISDGISKVSAFIIPENPTGFNANVGYTFQSAFDSRARSLERNISDQQQAGTNIVGGAGVQLKNRLCRLSIGTKSTANRIIGVYWNQGFSGPKDGRLQPPFMLRTTVAQDVSGLVICPRKQGFQPIDLVQTFHPNGNPGGYSLDGSNGNSVELLKMYQAGYLICDIAGEQNFSNFTGATGSNWGAPAGMVYRKKMLEWVRKNIQGTKNVFLVGQSMGAMNALRFHAMYPNVAKGIIGVSGAVDLSDSYTNRGFSAIIQKAFGTWYVNIANSTGIDPAQSVVTTGTNAISATSITVSALTATIPSGTILTLQTGTGQVTVVTTAQANSGATSISVTALTVAINAGARYDMTAYWTQINFGYGAPDDIYYESPYTWRDTYVGATAYTVNNIVTKPSTGTVNNFKFADPTLQFQVYKNIPIRLFHGSADVLIPPSQMTNFASLVNGIGGNVVTTAIAEGGHLTSDVYKGDDIVSFLNSIK